MKVESVCEEFIRLHAQARNKSWREAESILERGIVETSPIMGLKAPTKEESRDRVLGGDEIVRLLCACRNDVYPFRQFVPILLATAQRQGELAEIRWSEVDLDAKQWVIPADRSKNGKPHVVPLSPYALDILNEVPRFLDYDYVVTTPRAISNRDSVRRRWANSPRMKVGIRSMTRPRHRKFAPTRWQEN